MNTMTARPPHLDSLQGRGFGAGGYDAKFTSVWKIWPSTCLVGDASGKLCTNDLKKERHQHTLSNDGDIYALDRACDGTRSPLPDIFPKFLSSKSYSVHTERTQSQRRIEEPHLDLDVGCVAGGMLQVRETLQRSQRSIEERKYHVPPPKCRCRRVVASND